MRDVCEAVRERLRTRAPSQGHWTAQEVSPVLKDLLEGSRPNGSTREVVERRAMAELVGLGPLEEYLHDPDVQEIMVNGPQAVFLEIDGLLRPAARHFRDAHHLHAVIERMLASAGKSISEQRPFAEGSLADGSRFHVVAPPMALHGPALTIRLYPTRLLSLAELTERYQALPYGVAGFLELAVRQHSSILFAGGSGVGKTTMMNAMASGIADDERIVSLETTAELRLPVRNWVPLECLRAGPDGRGGTDLRELLRNALRMRPDRLLVGECLGAEAFDLLQAMNTGHRGCMATIHANSPLEALERILTLALLAGVPVPAETMRRQIAAGIQLVVQLARLPGGSRRVTSVAAVHPTAEGLAALRSLVRIVVTNNDPRGALAVSWEVTDDPDDLPPAWSPQVRAEALATLAQPLPRPYQRP